MKKVRVGVIALAALALATPAFASTADFGSPPDVVLNQQSFKTDSINIAGVTKYTPALASVTMGTKGNSPQSSLLTAKAPFLGIGSAAIASTHQTTIGVMASVVMTPDSGAYGAGLGQARSSTGMTMASAMDVQWVQAQVSPSGGLAIMAASLGVGSPPTIIERI